MIAYIPAKKKNRMRIRFEAENPTALLKELNEYSLLPAPTIHVYRHELKRRLRMLLGPWACNMVQGETEDEKLVRLLVVAGALVVEVWE